METVVFFVIVVTLLIAVLYVRLQHRKAIHELSSRCEHYENRLRIAESTESDNENDGRCEYCGGYTEADERGLCVACGAQRTNSYTNSYTKRKERTFLFEKDATIGSFINSGVISSYSSTGIEED